jgi:two-component system, chemotaxis family, response regulator WspF
MRIAIVNDMMMAMEALRRVVRSCPDYTIAWTARDGAEAVQKCAADTPDIILMDLIMPLLNGVEATRLIMRDSPCAILVVTATVDGNISLVFEAMGLGALDAVNTPMLGLDGNLTGAKELLAKMELVGRLIGNPRSSTPALTAVPKTTGVRQGVPPLVVFGASTGGPAALATILASLPQNLDAGVVVVQHVDAQFAPDLAVWLRRHCPIDVQVATPGCRPLPGTVWLAATNDHLILMPEGTLEYCHEPAYCFYRPSADVLFKSVAERWPTPGVAVLLTGMGRDGSEGLLALRKTGWHTIAQNEKTSVVYGMPKAAVELGAAIEILPLADISGAIQTAVTRPRQPTRTS